MAWNLTYGPRVGHWVAARMGTVYCEAGMNALGLEKDGEVQAGVIYENYNGKSVMCHIAVRKMTPKYLAYIFDYPFRQLNVEKIVVPVDSQNSKSLRLVTSMGFKEEARLKDAIPGGDVVFLTLNRVECRFINKRYAKYLEGCHG